MLRQTFSPAARVADLGCGGGGRFAIRAGSAGHDRHDEGQVRPELRGHLRRATELLEKATGNAARFPNRVRKFLQDSLALRDRRDAGRISDHGLAVARGRLEKRLDRLLNARYTHAGNRRFRNHLDKHRQEILTFLYEADIEATNWPAEQAMRPAVRNRKLFGGNRTWSGAAAQESLGSVLATFAKNAIPSLDTLSRILCRPIHAG